MNSNDFDNNAEVKTLSDLDRVHVIDFENDLEYRAGSTSLGLFTIDHYDRPSIIIDDNSN